MQNNSNPDECKYRRLDMTIPRYYPSSANTFHLISCHAFHFIPIIIIIIISNPFESTYFSRDQKSYSIRRQSHPLSSAKPLSLSLSLWKIRTLPFIPSRYRRGTKYPNRCSQTKYHEKHLPRTTFVSSRCSPPSSPSSCPRNIIPHFLVGPLQIRGSVVQEIAWPWPLTAISRSLS